MDLIGSSPAIFRNIQYLRKVASPRPAGNLRDLSRVERWIQALKSIIGKKLLTLGFQKPHWQEGFFDHLLRSHDSYSEKWDYVRMNPVQAGLSRTPEAWPYQGEITKLPFD